MDMNLPENPSTQQVYEHIRRYFMRPEAVLAKADFSTVCQYRTSNGNKCAVGCCIPDELYDSPWESESDDDWAETLGGRIEENGVNEIAGLPPLVDLLNGDSEEGQRKLRFLFAAQKAHDGHAQDARDFVRLLDVLADSFGLSLHDRYGNPA